MGVGEPVMVMARDTEGRGCGGEGRTEREEGWEVHGRGRFGAKARERMRHVEL